MIVVPILLASAVTGKTTDLGTLVLDNVTDYETLMEYQGKLSDYRARMYRKGDLAKFGTARLVSKAKPIREARVVGHRRLTEPVQNLVAKALKEMGYG